MPVDPKDDTLVELTIRIKKDGRPEIEGPLDNREACLRLVSEALTLLLKMPQHKPDAKPKLIMPPPELVGELSQQHGFHRG